MASLVWAFFCKLLCICFVKGVIFLFLQIPLLRHTAEETSVFLGISVQGQQEKRNLFFAVLLRPTTVSALLKIKEEEERGLEAALLHFLF